MVAQRSLKKLIQSAALSIIAATILLLLFTFFPGAQPPSRWKPQRANATAPVRILCWIPTQPVNFETRARAVSVTWAQRCDAFFFLTAATSAAPSDLPLVMMKVRESHDSLWMKTRAAFEFIHDKHLQNYDFFLKADDDSYILMENLRYFLRNADPSQPLVAGRRFRPFTRNGYMSGGGSYVLSRAAVALFVEKALKQKTTSCQRRWGPEDINIGQCLENVGVKILDSLDEKGRERFHPLDAKVHVNFDQYPRTVWLWQYNYHPIKLGMDCCSDSAISFHYIDPMKMREMHYLIYQLRPHGLPPDSVESPTKPLLITDSIAAAPGSD